MQIQKHLFRIAERALQSSNAPCYWKIIMLFCFTMTVYFSTVFLVGTYIILPNQNDLSQCFDKALNQQQNKFIIQQDAIYIAFPKKFQLSIMKQIQSTNQTRVQNEYCTIIQGLNLQKYTQHPFQFTWTPNVLYFSSQERQKFKFTNYTIILKKISTIKYFIYGMNNLLTNQLIYNFKGKFLPNPFIKSSDIIINTPLPGQPQTLDKIGIVIRSLIYYIVISIVTSLYIYGTIIAAPAVIIMFLRCSQFARNGGNMSEVYKIFPWIGMHSLIRQTSTQPQVKKKSKQICAAIIYYFFFLYFVYYAIVVRISNDIFYRKTQLGLEQVLFGYIALIQFCAIVFMRTRPFLKYFPTTHTLLLFVFLLYGQFSIFGFKKIALSAAISASSGLFAYLVLQLQIPAQTSWKVGQNFNKTKQYRPTADRPRIGFLPLFNLGWINNLPDEWTLMFPLFGRQNFTKRQLAFVDRNFEQLDQIFNNNQPVAQ